MPLSLTSILLLTTCACALGTSTPPPAPDHDHQHHHPPPSSSAPPSTHVYPVQSDRMVMDEPSIQPHKVHMMGHDGHDMDMDGDMDMNMGNMTHMMMMYFHFGFDEYVLFKEWKISTIGGLVGAVFGVFVLGMLYEGLKYFREHLFKRHISSIQFSTVAITGESGKVTQVHKVERHRMLSAGHALQTALHVVQIVVSYFLMLIFMTYNVWLCLAVVAGAGVGYFVFGWRKASVVDITEHCH